MFEYGLLTFIDRFDFDCDYDFSAEPVHDARPGRVERDTHRPCKSTRRSRARARRLVTARSVNSLHALGIRIVICGRVHPRSNPEIQPVSITTQNLTSRRPRPTPFLLFHLRQSDFRFHVQDVRSGMHQPMLRIRIAQRPSRFAAPSVVLCHPSLKVRTNYETRSMIIKGGIVYRL